MNNMQFAIINKNHFIIMFVNRKASRIKPGLKETQVYVPHKQHQLCDEYLPIKSKYMAQHYYNELDRLGWIDHPIIPPPNINNTLMSIIFQSNGFLQLGHEGNSNLLTLVNVPADSIEPEYDPTIQYDIRFYYAPVLQVEWSDGLAHQYMITTYLDHREQTITSQTITMQYVYAIIRTEGLYIFFTNEDAKIYVLLDENNVNIKLMLSHVNTAIAVLFQPHDNQ